LEEFGRVTWFLGILVVLVWIFLSVGLAILINEMQVWRLKKGIEGDLRKADSLLRKGVAPTKDTLEIFESVDKKP
jgi:hypothetical protein